MPGIAFQVTGDWINGRPVQKLPSGGISRTGDGDILLGNCQRSSHDPEAVHLHLTLTHLDRVPLIVVSGAGWYPDCQLAASVSINESCRQTVH